MHHAALRGHVIIVTWSSNEQLQTKLETLYRVMQKGRAMLLKVIVLVIVKNIYMIMCKILIGCRERENERERAVWMKRHQNIVTGKKLIEITDWLINFIYNLIFTWQILLHINNKFLTVHNKLSKIPPSTSVNLVTCVRRSRVARLLSWSSH